MNKYLPLIIFLAISFVTHAQEKGALTPRLIAIQVKKLETSRDWYVRNLGFEVKTQNDYKEYKIRIAVLKANGFEIELVEHENSFSVRDLVPDAGDQKPSRGFAKLTFNSTSIESLYEKFKSNGASIKYELSSSNVNPAEKFFMTTDPDGNLIQFIGH